MWLNIYIKSLILVSVSFRFFGFLLLSKNMQAGRFSYGKLTLGGN